MHSTAARIGAFCRLLVLPVLVTAQLVVQSAWNRPYSWARHNISDLGNVHCGPWGDDHRYVCSPWHAGMNATFVACGVLMAAGLTLGWPRRRRSVLLLTSCGGWILAGFVPADVNENLHVLGAVLIFGLGNLGLLLAARLPWPPPLRLLAAVAGAVGLVAMYLTLAHHDLGLGPGGMERVTAFALPAWLAVAGLTALRRRPTPPTNQPDQPVPADPPA